MAVCSAKVRRIKVTKEHVSGEFGGPKPSHHCASVSGLLWPLHSWCHLQRKGSGQSCRWQLPSFWTALSSCGISYVGRNKERDGCLGIWLYVHTTLLSVPFMQKRPSLQVPSPPKKLATRSTYLSTKAANFFKSYRWSHDSYYLINPSFFLLLLPVSTLKHFGALY